MYQADCTTQWKMQVQCKFGQLFCRFGQLFCMVNLKCRMIALTLYSVEWVINKWPKFGVEKLTKSTSVEQQACVGPIYIQRTKCSVFETT